MVSLGLYVNSSLSSATSVILVFGSWTCGSPRNLQRENYFSPTASTH